VLLHWHLQLLQPLLAVRKFCHRKNESSSHRYTWVVCDNTTRCCVKEATTTKKGNIRHTCWLWHEGQPWGQPWRSFPSQKVYCLTQSRSESWRHKSCCSRNGSSSHQSIWALRGKPARGNDWRMPHASGKWHTSQRFTAFVVVC